MAGPGDAFALGSGHESKGRDFPLLNELDHYSRLRALFVPNSPTPSLRAQGVKIVAVNPNGVELCPAVYQLVTGMARRHAEAENLDWSKVPHPREQDGTDPDQARARSWRG
ncbi:hypothetical protein [Hymenobacter sp. BRD67]|uniref:hypothetical protein n=1 Tax=Hymenobacter sp. BRD67 TaxID=2675877 RepID=UPI001566A7BE|nr:hypothetical protein [Hymenobacter sp. BRD67]QKG55155.1 hypothetical protein GKZ67_21820 [Hymenobacter sp. BRD67]